MTRPNVAPLPLAKIDSLPVDGSWVYEPYIAGLRAIFRKSDDSHQITGHGNNDIDKSFPEIFQQLPNCIEASQAVIDGEVAALDNNGEVNMGRRFRTLGSIAVYYAYDLLELDGEPLKNEPWFVRREYLEKIFKEQPRIKLVTTFDQTELNALHNEAIKRCFSGIVAKRVDAPYFPRPKSARAWVRYTYPTNLTNQSGL